MTQTEIDGLHSLLDDTTISSEIFINWIKQGTVAEVPKPLEKIREYMMCCRIPSLFRIRPPSDYAIDEVTNSKFGLSRADKFNDPFDCLLYFDMDKLLKKINGHLTSKNLKNSLQKRIGLNAITSKTQRIIDMVMDNLAQKKECFLETVQKELIKSVQLLQQTTFVGCLTQDITSPVIWSHYGESHAGFAIEYVFQPSFCVPRLCEGLDDNIEWCGWQSILPVQYSDVRPDATMLAEWFSFYELKRDIYRDANKMDLPFPSPDLLLKTKLSLQKSKEWSYEKEWRVIISKECPNYSKEERMHIQLEPKALYLGERINRKWSDKLRGIAREKELLVYEMYVDPQCVRYEMQHRRVL